jgi:hypothetical protein
MSDPRLTDPRDYRRPDLAGPDIGSAANAIWGWVAAAVFVAVVLLFVFASGSNDTASNGVTLPPTASAPKLPPASTTGAGPSAPTMPPASAPQAAPPSVPPGPGGANQ